MFHDIYGCNAVRAQTCVVFNGSVLPCLYGALGILGHFRRQGHHLGRKVATATLALLAS